MRFNYRPLYGIYPLSLLAFLVGCDEKKPARQMPLQSVGAVKAVKQNVPLVIESPAKIMLNYDILKGIYQRRDLYDKKLIRPWTLEKIPALSDWIKEAEEPLDAIAEMLRKPLFVCPLISFEPPKYDPPSLLFLPFYEYQDCREIARLFESRANYRIAKGDIDGAVNDTISIYLLGNHIAKDPNFILAILVANSITIIAHNIPLNANPNHPPTKEQIQRLLNTINQLPPRTNLLDIAEFERTTVLDATQTALRTKELTHFTSDKLKVPILAINQNTLYNRVNKIFDISIHNPNESYKYKVNLYTTATWIKRITTSSGRGIIIADIINSHFHLHADALKSAFNRLDCLFNMKCLTLAMLMYKADHGDFPKADWIEKIKPYLSDNFEKYLHCPSCLNNEKNKTNYALILYDKLPEYNDSLQLIELREPVPFDQATITVNDTVNEFQLDKNISKIGSYHSNGINTTRQNGAVIFLRESDYKNTAEIQKLLGQESGE
jgi:hypothetical protein